MIWLIGYKGMLGTAVLELLKKQEKPYMVSDQEIDITNIDQLHEFTENKSISWIINCAAYTAVDKAEDEQELAFKINAEGPFNIAQIIREKGAKLIHISTDYVFDGTKDGAYEEDDVPHPLGIYAKSKYQGERNIMACIDSYFMIRTAWLYGRNGQNFVHTMLRLFREKSEVRVVADQWGSPTYAPDLAEVIINIINADSVHYGIYNFTNAGRINWHQFALEIHDLAQRKGLIDRTVQISPISSEQYPTRVKRPLNSYLSKDKIYREFKITPKPWQESLKTFLWSLEK
jgi:dTDP-4-dehydrorhamnose reductase